ncbi:MAG: hypothetical protein IKJ29_05830, partial [Akkermansia sp.]|nr:hypothetical protein [Akkermansia sp.]
IGRVLFQFPPNSGTAQIPVGKSQNNAVTTSAGTNEQASASNVAQSPEQVNIYDVQIRDSSGNVIFQQPVEPKANFSVVGSSAKNWVKIKHRAFRGRDDGKLRVELDASQAKLKKKIRMHRLDDSVVREVQKRLVFFRESLEQRGRWEIVREMWTDGEYNYKTWDEMDYLRRVLRGAGLEFGTLEQMGELGVFSLGVDAGDAAAVKRLLKKGSMPGVEGFNLLGEVLDFPELYSAYPQLKELPIRWMDDSFRYRASYVTGGRFAEHSPAAGRKYSVLLDHSR